MENEMIADPLVLEIYLYKSNYKDRLLIAELREKAQIIHLPDDGSNSFFVKADEVNEILNTKFLKDLRDFDSTPLDHIASSVTSIYFIDMMLSKYHTLKYFKVSISDSTIYSRAMEDMVNFGSKIIHAKLDLPAILDQRDFEKVRSVFKLAGLINKSLFNHIPYIEIQTDDLLRALDYGLHKRDLYEESEEFSVVDSVRNMLGERLIKDNANLLIVVDQ
jgi:hypothetical protein